MHVRLSSGTAQVRGAETESPVHRTALVQFLGSLGSVISVPRSTSACAIRPFPLLQQTSSPTFAVSFWSLFFFQAGKNIFTHAILLLIHLDSYLDYTASHSWRWIQVSSFVSTRKRSTLFLSSVMRTGYRILGAQCKTKGAGPLLKYYAEFQDGNSPLHTPTTSDLAALVGATSIWLY